MKKLAKIFTLDTALLCIISALIILTLGAGGCATKPKNIVSINRASDINTEVARTRKDIDTEKENDLQFLSPRNFSRAEEALKEAEIDTRDKNISNNTFENLEVARAWLSQAREIAPRAKEELAQPLLARSYAKNVPTHSNEDLETTDMYLIDFAKDIEIGNAVSQDDRIKLSNRYTEIEKKRLTRAYLDPVENRIEQARENGAKRLTPKSLKIAIQELKASEDTLKIIPFDRTQFLQRVKVADKSSKELLEISERASSGSMEDLVLGQRDERRKTEEQISTTQQKVEAALKKEAELAQQKRDLQSQVANLKEKAQPQELLVTLKEELPPDKADIALSTNGEVMIRLKDLQFKTNSADLTPEAAVTLANVKNALAGVRPQRLRIDGHTDATGPSAANKRLSQTRAESVARFLKSDGTLADADFEVEGFGAEKPIKNNQTKSGRAENRRVEIFIANEASGQVN